MIGQVWGLIVTGNEETLGDLSSRGLGTSGTPRELSLEKDAHWPRSNRYPWLSDFSNVLPSPSSFSFPMLIHGLSGFF